MKRDVLERQVLGPTMTLLAGMVLILLTKLGVHFPQNESILFIFITFSGFYAGVGSATVSVLVAAGLYFLTRVAPGVFPIFFDKGDVTAIGFLLPFIVIMVGLLRRRLDKRINESEEGYRLVVENIDEVFFVMTSDFSHLYYISPAFERIWQRPIANLYVNPESWLDAIHPDDRKKLVDDIRSAAASGSFAPGANTLFRIRRDDGTQRWISHKTVFDPAKLGIPNRIIGVAHDITAEIEARTKEENISNRLKTVLNNAPIAIFSTDKDGLLTLREGRGSEKAGVKPGEGIGESYAVQFKDVPRHVENVHRALRGETFSDRLTVRSGYFNIVYSPIRGEGGSIEGMVGVATDITEQQKAEKQVGELDTLKNKFISIVSHQLRTPLSVARWNLESVLSSEGIKSDPDNEPLVRVSHQATSEVIGRIGDLLTALDIEEGKIRIENEDVDFGDILSGVMGDVAQLCKAKDVQCRGVVVKVKMPIVKADPTKLRIALQKIVGNAVQYSKAGGEVGATVKEIDGRLRAEVFDKGVGIPKSEQHRVFNRFFRASNASAIVQDASGLGLYIAKYYIEANGGKIGFESEEGKGSKFCVELPIA